MSWTITATGRKVSVTDLNAQDIDILDIAAALAKLCRFTGACREFYSVAQHSVLVSRLLAEAAPADFDLQMCGLLHDAPEYLLQDVATPVKALLADYKPLERAVWWAVAECFRLPQTMPAAVTHADLVALATEKRDLMPAHPEPWSLLDGIKPHPKSITALPWERACSEFVYRYAELKNARADA